MDYDNKSDGHKLYGRTYPAAFLQNARGGINSRSNLRSLTFRKLRVH